MTLTLTLTPTLTLTLTPTLTLTLTLALTLTLTLTLTPTLALTPTLTLTLTQVPLTHVYGSNSLWVESAPGLADFQPVEACSGQAQHRYGHPYP